MPPPPSKPNEPVDWPIPKFNLRVDDLSHSGVSLFFRNVEALPALKDAVLSSFKWLYSTPDKVPTNVKSILLVLRPMEGVAYTCGSASEKEIHLSLDHIKNSEARAKEEILGVITHEIVHCYQYDARKTCPGGLIEGFADYVRLRSSLDPPHWKRNGGDKHKWDAGYETTGYFLDWIARTHGEDKLRGLNERMKDAKYDEKMFIEVTGKSVHALWKAYSHELDIPVPPPPRPRNPTTNWPEPQLNFRVEDLEDPGAKIFFEHINPITALKEAMASTFKWLYAEPEKAPNDVDSILLVLRAMDGTAYTTGSWAKEIHISLNHIKNSEKRAKDEILGVLTHEMVHCWQYNAKGTCPGGLIEGVADFVRLHTSLAPPHWKRSGGENDKWDDGYEKTGYFLDWIGQSKVRELNERMKDVEYDEEALFVAVAGKTVAQLWKSYCEEVGKGNGGRWSVLSWRSKT